MKKHLRSCCPVACALDLLGDKWTLLVVRDLMLGRRYFKEFLASPERIATNILADRLKKLTDAGLVEASLDPNTAGRSMYFLTDKGASMNGLLETIRDWGLINIEGTSVKVSAAS